MYALGSRSIRRSYTTRRTKKHDRWQTHSTHACPHTHRVLCSEASFAKRCGTTLSHIEFCCESYPVILMFPWWQCKQELLTALLAHRLNTDITANDKTWHTPICDLQRSSVCVIVVCECLCVRACFCEQWIGHLIWHLTRLQIILATLTESWWESRHWSVKRRRMRG